MQLGAGTGSDDDGVASEAMQPDDALAAACAEAAVPAAGAGAEPAPLVAPRLSEALLRRIMRTVLGNWEVIEPTLTFLKSACLGSRNTDDTIEGSQCIMSRIDKVSGEGR